MMPAAVPPQSTKQRAKVPSSVVGRRRRSRPDIRSTPKFSQSGTATWR